MFENLSSREKTLAIIIGSLAPIFVLFFGFMWFMDRYETSADEIDDLMSQIEMQEDKTKRGVLAAQRQRYYRKTSLPSETSRAKNMYKNWLDDVIRLDVGMDYNGVTFQEGGKLVFERDTVAMRNSVTLRPKGTLQQLLKFLHVFYSADQLHRINKLSIKPVAIANRGKAPVLTGELQLDIEIEMLSLVDGPARMESFPAWKNEMAEVDEYGRKILARNIFGPANNKPVFEKPSGLEFVFAETEDDAVGKYKTIQIKATDADAENLLAFELIEESGSENEFGLVIGEQPRTASQRQISLRVPMQAKAVRIPVSLGVVDSGMPAKRNEIKFTIVFKPPEKDAPKTAPKPAAKFATMSSVKGLMREVDGRWVALVSVQSESHKLGAGDLLKLDEKDWKVLDVNRRNITFEVDGETMTFGLNSFLSEPLNAL